MSQCTERGWMRPLPLEVSVLVTFNTIINDTSADRKESFLFSYEAEEDPVPPTLTESQRSLLMHNLWPEDDPEFRKESWAYHGALLTLARKMMRAFALGLGEYENVFDESVTAPNTSIKKIHYPPQETGLATETGIGAHTDFVCMFMIIKVTRHFMHIFESQLTVTQASPSFFKTALAASMS